MLRKLNFTDRAKIPRAAVRIVLRRESDGVLAFEPLLDLAGISVAGEARIYIEAHYRTSYMRFDCGTVAHPDIPENRRLSEIDSNGVVRFRLKIVDNATNEHRIVAASEDITVSADDEGGARVSLLPVNFRDLGDVPWLVQMDGGPVLELNNRIEGIERLARNDPVFFALVYPAAVRAILTEILLVEDYDVFEESEEWWSLWMRWAREMTDAPLPESRDDRREWIDDVVAGFCGRHSVVEKMHRPDAEGQA